MTERIKAYARLLIEVGINLQKGQPLVISSPVDCAPFARLCASAAYKAGCREVFMNWTDDYMTREKYLHGQDSIFDTFPTWTAEFYNKASEMGAGWLGISASDPEALAGVDPERLRRASISSGNAIKPFRQRQMTNFFPWCVASVPTAAWAKKVYPGLEEKEAITKLWLAILDAVRVYENDDPVAQWRRHSENLKKRVDILNRYNFRYLKYKNALGTDLTVELPQNHIWEGGSERTEGGVPFCANMPTEEVFTAPKRDGVNGIVYASKPLVINGDIAENFCFTLKGGKIVKVEAEKGKELLEKAIAVDEGSSYLGEVALVPYNSPISNSNTLFYNTLFDENASCHLAFGEAYPCVKGGAKMTPDELKKAGLNASFSHEDFMVGTADLEITGITQNGEEVSVFHNGNFSF